MELSVKNCRCISEEDLIKLGPGWRKLRRLDFVVDAYYGYPKLHDHLLLSECHKEVVHGDELKESSFSNCIVALGQGLSFIPGRCNALEKVRLDLCIGVTHSDIVALSRKSSNLRRLAMHLPLVPGIFFENSLWKLQDDSLRALAAGCPVLNTLELSYSDWDFPPSSCFTQDAMIALIQSSPIRVLNLHGAGFLNDIGMKALCAAQCLQILELTKFQKLATKDCKCLGVTDTGLKPLVDSHKLDLLTVEGCPQISEKGIKGAARSISYKQDLSWLY